MNTYLSKKNFALFVLIVGSAVLNLEAHVSAQSFDESEDGGVIGILDPELDPEIDPDTGECKDPNAHAVPITIKALARDGSARKCAEADSGSEPRKRLRDINIGKIDQAVENYCEEQCGTGNVINAWWNFSEYDLICYGSRKVNKQAEVSLNACVHCECKSGCSSSASDIDRLLGVGEHLEASFGTCISR